MSKPEDIAELKVAQTVSDHDDDDFASSSLLDCLMLVAQLEGRTASLPAVTAGLPLVDGKLTPELFIRAANRAGLAAKILNRTLNAVPRDVLPAILSLSDQTYAVVTDIDSKLGYAIVMAPVTGESRQVEISALDEIYSGHVFYLRPMQQFDNRVPRIYRNTGEHWFWGVIKSSAGIYRDVLVASLLINLFVLAQPLFVMNVYDRVVPNSAMETLWALALGVVIVYLFDMALKSMRSYFVELAAKRSDVILSAQLLEKVLALKMENRPVSVGAFTNRLQEFDSIRSFITSTSILTLIDLPFLVLFLVVIFYLGGWLVVVPLLAIPVAVVLGFNAQRRLKPAIENVMRGSARKNATLVESMVGVETIKTLGAEGKVQRNWEQSVGYVSQWSLQARKISNSTLVLVQSLQQFAMVAIVVWGVYLIADQSLTLGGLIACVILSGRALAPLGQVASLITNYDHAEATLKSLNDIMSQPVEREPDKRYLHKPVLRGDIRFKNVTFSYNEYGEPALNNVTLTISAGEKVGIIGKIGSGKSSLGKLLIRLYEADKGAVLVDGFDILQLDPSDLRHNIGYVSQDITLFYGSIRENIAMGVNSVTDQQIIDAAASAGVLGFINRHPLGFDMPVGERGETLSGGQRQALGLARMFLRDPPVLLLDEPTASMDQGSEHQIRKRLEHFAADKTLILVTHKMAMLDLVDRLIVMDSGRVLADGPRDQVITSLKQGDIRRGDS